MLVGYGYLGHELHRRFQQKGWESRTASLSGKNSDIACSVADRDAVNALPDADYVIHCASSGRQGTESSYQRVYVDGCRNLAHRYPGVPILFTSSTKVYGQTGGEIVTESSPADPTRERGQLLLNAEHSILNAGGAVARLSCLYGPSRSRQLELLLSGEAIIEGDGSRYLNHIHRDDAADAIIHIMENRLTGIFNVTDSLPMHQIDCYRDLARIYKKPVPPRGTLSANRMRGWSNNRVSNAHLRATGWEPRHLSYTESLQNMQQNVTAAAHVS